MILTEHLNRLAKANGCEWHLETKDDFPEGPLRIRITFVYPDPTKSWIFVYRANTMSALQDKFSEELVRTCRSYGMTIPEDEPKVESCKVCGGELVKIRGKFPCDDKRIVCPTCQADKLYDIKQLIT